MTKFVYIHGGPGFNTNPECTLLLPSWEAQGLDVTLWNEPSIKRGDFPTGLNAYEACIQSLTRLLTSLSKNDEIILIGHSYGSRTASRLSRVFKNQISRLILIAPVFHLPQADEKIFNLTLTEFEKSSPLKASAYAQTLAALNDSFDQSRIDAFIGALSNTALFDNYWSNSTLKERYLNLLSEPNYEFDFDNLVSIRQNEEAIDSGFNISVPVTAVFGGRDSITPKNLELPFLMKIAQDLEIETFEDAMHYPQFEDAKRFTAILKKYNR